MSNNTGTDADDGDFQPRTEYNFVEKIGDIINGNNIQQTATNCGGTLPATTNQDEYYDKPGSLFSKKLILPKNLKSPFDIRYKTDYFPRGGMNAGKSQSPRYLHTVDGKQEITIKFEDNCEAPQNCANIYLEVALLTVPRVNQHHKHGNKFQLDNKDINVKDENPFFVLVTPEHLEKGEITVKLVPVKTPKNDLKEMRSLPLFDPLSSSGWTADCKTVDDLEHTYELSHAVVAFSLGYIKSNGQFVRFTNTTVMSNEIIEKEKSKPLDNVTCPNCSHNFSVKEQKQANRKRSASSSNTTGKKKNRSQ